MKKIILVIFTINILSPFVVNAQQIDPALTAAIGAQALAMNEAYKKRNETQNKLIIAQGAVAAAMNEVHKVEETMLNYMSNASAAMDNLYQLQRAAKLTVKIGEQLIEMGNAIPKNYKGVAITAFTSRTTEEVSLEMASLYEFMQTMVTSTSYSFSNKKDSSGSTSSGGGKKNVNLLSAAERYYIANEVVYRLEKIYNKLWTITWQIKNLGWEDAWMNLDSQSWAQMNNGKSIANSIIRRWNNTKF